MRSGSGSENKNRTEFTRPERVPTRRVYRERNKRRPPGGARLILDAQASLASHLIGIKYQQTVPTSMGKRRSQFPTVPLLVQQRERRRRQRFKATVKVLLEVHANDLSDLYQVKSIQRSAFKLAHLFNQRVPFRKRVQDKSSDTLERTE